MQESGRVLKCIVSFCLLALAVSANGFSAAGALDEAYTNANKLAIPVIQQAPERPMTADDLARLRYFGRVRRDNDWKVFSISPDRKRIAFQLFQGDPTTNKYRVGWFVAAIDGGGRPINVGDGGEVSLEGNAFSGPDGFRVAASTAKWSPDGNWIAYLAKKAGAVQLWRSRVDGGRQQQITYGDGDVVDFSWNPNGQELRMQIARKARNDFAQRLEAEARTGYRLDDRFDLDLSRRPLDRDTVATDEWTVQVEPDGRRPVAHRAHGVFSIEPSVDERLKAVVKAHSIFTAAAALFEGESRKIAFAQVINPPDREVWPTAIVSILSADKPDDISQCADSKCKGLIRRVWWSSNGRGIYFERETENYISDGLYLWSLEDGTVKTIVHTDTWLTGCEIYPQGADDAMLCQAETPIHPAILASISLKTGAIAPIIDPNPEFKNIQLTATERIEWTTSSGDGVTDETFGYLIKPRGYQLGLRYPLVVLTKEAIGFLRDSGGGNEYPAHLFADKGMMVFICQEPWQIYNKVGEKGRFQNNFQMRRHTQASLEAGIQMLEGRGLIDADRIALTGFSDGADITYFALVHSSRRYAAAIVSSPGYESIDYFVKPGDLIRAVGKPMGIALERGMPTPWIYDGLAPSRNVEKINAPILFNIASTELLSARQTTVTMDESGKPFEAYVFPEEYHLKWQPAHLYAIWRRNTQWLEFWLQDKEVADPMDADQYARWRKLREMQGAISEGIVQGRRK
jgi:dipeptidyl aminopeptidase/acylaminoacyl peptidase